MEERGQGYCLDRSPNPHHKQRKSMEEVVNGIGEITFPLVLGSNNSSDRGTIRAQISRWQVNWIPKFHSLVSRESIHDLSEKSIWRSSTTMQKMGIVVSIIHEAIKFHTPRKIGTVFSIYEPNKVEEGHKKVKETIPEVMKDVLNCVDAKEMIIVNEKYLEQTIVIGKQLPTNFKRKLQDLLRSNVDVFAWTYANMTGIPRTIMIGGKIACKEVDELINAGILQEVKDQTWVANPVMGYHQIQMADGDEDKTAFFTRKGVCCYQKMPFGLKNAKATYQRLVDKKCSFGVEEGLFLGDLITQQGIKANPLKVNVITSLKPPRTLKEIQSLNGKLAALSRFLSKGVDKSLPFFKQGDFEGAGLMLISPEAKEYTYALRFEFKTTNNEAEYEALLSGLRIAEEIEI
ncbi:reverse transcriptase domain-containing protein [Tanacetum coccineum]